jgi:hypothetical protein
MRSVAYKGYTVYENGNIVGKKGIRKISQRPDGYLQITTMDPINWKKRVNYMHHRFIYEAFNGPVSDSMHVDHIDQNKTNNNLSNLRILSPKQNMHNRGGKYKL